MIKFQDGARSLALALAIFVSHDALSQTPVHFADPSLEAAIRLAVNKLVDDLTSSDLLLLTSLSASGQNITNLSGLEHATNLTYLGLEGNSISNLDCLAGLHGLYSLGLSYNKITYLAPLAGLTNLVTLNLTHNLLTNCSHLADLGARLADLFLDLNQLADLQPLTSLTNLQSLSVYANPIVDHAWVGAMTNLYSLDLGNTGMSQLDGLAGLSRVRYLMLSGNHLSDLTPLAAMTNLSTLNLDVTGGTNFNVLVGLTNLTWFYAYGNGIRDLGFVRNWTQLQLLDVSQNPLEDLGALAGLTNLHSLWASYDRLTNITALQDLPQLTTVSLQWNLLDLGPGSAAMQVIQGLLDRGVSVYYQPQQQPPNLPVPTAWTIAANATSYLNFNVSDDLDNSGQVSIHANSSNLGLIPDGALELGGANADRWLAVTPLANQTGLTTVTLTATDTTGLSTKATILVEVRWATNVVFADPNLDSSLRQFLNKPQGTITTLDLEGMTYLEAGWRSIRDVSGLEYAHDLRRLFIDGNWIANATSLARLVQLTQLGLAYNQISDAAPLLGLTNLQYLRLSGNPVVNTEVLCGLRNLTDLELGSVPITNPLGLTCLTNLVSLGFDANTLSDPSPLLGLTNLQSLSLTGNRLPDCAVLTGFTNLSGLSVAEAGLTNVGCLSGLTRLGYLNLAGNHITDLSPLAGLTNLVGIDLTSNPVTNYSGLLGLTNLSSVTFTATGIEDLKPLKDITWLQGLTLSWNRLENLDGLQGMTNLTWLDLVGNRLTNIAALQHLPQLFMVYLQENLLDLSPGSPAMAVIQSLQGRGVMVYYQDQRKPPRIQVKPTWFIAANQPASLPFFTQGGTFYEPLIVTAHSSNQDLIPETNVVLAPTPDRWTWNLIVTPVSNQTGMATLTLTATEAAGLSTNAEILVHVEPPLAFNGSAVNCPDLLWQTSGNPPWTRQTSVSHDGVAAAQSGGEGSLLATTVTGPGTLSFWWSLASTGATARAEFSAVCASSGRSGITQVTPDGGWHRETVTLGHGTWALKWTASSGFWDDTDFARTLWLDEVTFTPGGGACWLEVVHHPPDARFWLALHGEPGGTYVLEVSSDLRNWRQLTRCTLEGFESSLSDADTEATARFYRLRRE